MDNKAVVDYGPQPSTREYANIGLRSQLIDILKKVQVPLQWGTRASAPHTQSNKRRTSNGTTRWTSSPKSLWGYQCRKHHQ